MYITTSLSYNGLDLIIESISIITSDSLDDLSYFILFKNVVTVLGKKLKH